MYVDQVVSIPRLEPGQATRRFPQELQQAPCIGPFMPLVVRAALDSMYGDAVDLFQGFGEIGCAQGHYVDLISTFRQCLCIAPYTIVILVWRISQHADLLPSIPRGKRYSVTVVPRNFSRRRSPVRPLVFLVHIAQQFFV